MSVWNRRFQFSRAFAKLNAPEVDMSMTRLLLFALLILGGCKSKSVERADVPAASDASAVQIPYFDINDGKKHWQSVRKLGVLIGGSPVAWKDARLVEIIPGHGVTIKCTDMEGPATISGIATTFCTAESDRP